MSTGQIISLGVALIAGVFAFLSQRSASKASRVNTQTVTAVDREKEAYERARAFDTETIERLDREADRLREDNVRLHERVTIAEREAHEAKEEARQAKLEAAEAKREAQAVMAENLELRSALAEFIERDNNPHR